MINRVGKAKCYKEVSICEDFKDYDLFLDWARCQIGFLERANGRLWNIDKDIIGDGSEYNKDVCVFIPSLLNNLCRDSYVEGRDMPKGVQFDFRYGKYFAAFKRSGWVRYSSYTDSMDEAFEYYKRLKLDYVNHLAGIYSDSVDSRVFPNLVSKIVNLEPY